MGLLIDLARGLGRRDGRNPSPPHGRPLTLPPLPNNFNKRNRLQGFGRSKVALGSSARRIVQGYGFGGRWGYGFGAR